MLTAVWRMDYKSGNEKAQTSIKKRFQLSRCKGVVASLGSQRIYLGTLIYLETPLQKEISPFVI